MLADWFLKQYTLTEAYSWRVERLGNYLYPYGIILGFDRLEYLVVGLRLSFGTKT